MEQTSTPERRSRLTADLVRLALHLFVPLACGTAVYLCFRSPALGVFELLRLANVSELALVARGLASPLRSHLPVWVVYSLPDGLWCYAATAASLLIWREQIDRLTWRVLVAGTGLTAACGLEWLQFAGVIDGTGDPMDVALSCVGFVAAVVATDTLSLRVRRLAAS